MAVPSKASASRLFNPNLTASILLIHLASSWVPKVKVPRALAGSMAGYKLVGDYGRRSVRLAVSVT